MPWILEDPCAAINMLHTEKKIGSAYLIVEILYAMTIAKKKHLIQILNTENVITADTERF